MPDLLVRLTPEDDVAPAGVADRRTTAGRNPCRTASFEAVRVP
jgi:hypothetical protein